MKKIVAILLLIFLIISNILIVYAVSKTYVSSNTNYYIMDTSDSTTTIVSSNVIFTQDNDYYYFDITQSLKNTKYYAFTYSNGYIFDGKNYIAFSDIPGIALLPVSNMTGLYIYPREVNTSSGGSSTLTIKLGETEIAYYNASSSSSKITNRKNYPMFFSTISDYYNSYVLGTGPEYASVISSSNTYEKYSVNDWTSKAKIKILKTKIDQYRYFRFYQQLYWQDNSRVDGGYQYEHRSGITNYSIDLKTIANCEHDWTMSGLTDKDNHRMTCSKCTWDKTEAHNYLYEYDGIKNNMCMCGKNNYVHTKYIINDDITKEVINKNESYSEIEPTTYNNKNGHEFLYYKKYQLEVENVEELSVEDTKLKKVFLSNVNDIDKNVGNNSLIYEAVYRPFVYYIQFNIENSLGLEFGEDYIDTQTMVYGELDQLYECKLKKDYYKFMGWAVKPNMDEVVFTDMCDIENLSDIDEDTVNLYPVFLPYTYTVYYTYADDEEYKIKKIYTFNKEEDLETFDYELPENKTFIGWNILNDTLKNATTKHLEQYIDKDNQVLMLVANIYEELVEEPESEAMSEPESESESDSEKKNDNNNDSNNNDNKNPGGNNNTPNNTGGGGNNHSSDGDDTYYDPKKHNDNNNNDNPNNNLVAGTEDGTPPFYDDANNKNNDNTKKDTAKNDKNINKSKEENNKNNGQNKTTELLFDETYKLKKVNASMNNLLNIKSFIYDYESNMNEITAFNFTLSTGSETIYDDNVDNNELTNKTNNIFDILKLKNIALGAVLGVFMVIFTFFIKFTFKKFKNLENYYEKL